MLSVSGLPAVSRAPRSAPRATSSKRVSAPPSSSVSIGTMANAIQDEDLINSVNKVAGTMDRHLSHVSPSQYEPFLTHGSSPASPLAQTTEVAEFYSKIQTGILSTTDSDLSKKLQDYLFFCLHLHDGGDRFKDVRGTDEDKHKRALLVHGLVQRDALHRFQLLNQLMSSYDEKGKEHLLQLMVDMQPIRIALPVKGIDNLSNLVDAIKHMEKAQDFNSGEFERFLSQLWPALAPDTDQLSIDRINYLLADFDAFNREEQRSRLAEIKLMITSTTVKTFKRKDPTHFQRKTSEVLYSFTDNPTFNQDDKDILPLKELLLAREVHSYEKNISRVNRDLRRAARDEQLV